jgi:hypothetical protein
MNEWPDEETRYGDLVNKDYKYPSDTPTLMKEQCGDTQSKVVYYIDGLFKTASGVIWFLGRKDRVENREFHRYVDKIIKYKCTGYLKVSINEDHDDNPRNEFYLFYNGCTIHLLSYIGEFGELPDFLEKFPIFSEFFDFLDNYRFVDNFPIEPHAWERKRLYSFSDRDYKFYPLDQFEYIHDDTCKELKKYILDDIVDICAEYSSSIEPYMIELMIENITDFFTDKEELYKLLLDCSLIVHKFNRGVFINKWISSVNTDEIKHDEPDDDSEITCLNIVITKSIAKTLLDHGLHYITLASYSKDTYTEDLRKKLNPLTIKECSF